MRRFKKVVGTISCLLLSAGVSANAQTIDQQQPLIDETAGFLGVGGDSDQKLAQTFKVGVTGRMIALDLPMACGGDYRIEIRQQAGGTPSGALVRRIEGTGTSLGVDGFQRYPILVPIPVTAGDELSFTVETLGGNCNYATSPDGNTYTDGQGFFDSRPNPPGWLALKGTLDTFKDLPFKTVMEDATIAGRGNCIANGVTDPNTGQWLELPIIRDVPACRCFEDPSLRELRCGAFHPDFFITRITPWPLVPGEPYEEIFDFSPITQLDGPVRMVVQGGGHEKPIVRTFGLKSKPGQSERFVTKAVAPAGDVITPGAAFFEYGMKDPTGEYQKAFGIDLTLDPALTKPVLEKPSLGKTLLEREVQRLRNLGDPKLKKLDPKK